MKTIGAQNLLTLHQLEKLEIIRLEKFINRKRKLAHRKGVKKK
jgi:hypothetical protein